MQKNKPLPIFIIENSSWKDDVSFCSEDAINSFNKESIVVIGLQGVSLSYEMQNEIEPMLSKADIDPKRFFFVHMSQNAFVQAKSDTLDKKVDFSLFHFYYDLFKVKKFNLAKFNFTHCHSFIL